MIGVPTGKVYSVRAFNPDGNREEILFYRALAGFTEVEQNDTLTLLWGLNR